MSSYGIKTVAFYLSAIKTLLFLRCQLTKHKVQENPEHKSKEHWRGSLWAQLAQLSQRKGLDQLASSRSLSA
jgi:hypothetical protein